MSEDTLRNMRPAWVEVNLDAIAHNTRVVKEYLGDTKLLAVVKADGYGLGAVQVAPVMLANGGDKLGVVMIDEGIELRQAGIDAPIMNIAGILPEHAPLVVQYELEQTVNSTEVAEALSTEAGTVGKKVVAHLKVDTGMSRWGVRYEKTAEWICQIARLSNLVIESVFTHFPMSDELDKSFAELQIFRFRQVKREVEKKGIAIPTWHMANSGGTVDLPDAHFDMVRNGIMLYGYFPSREVRRPFDLHPAMSVKARIMQLNTIHRGDTVGYGRRYMSEGTERIAVLQIGYSDGYDRRLRNVGTVLINGRRAPIVGGICMDACFVNVTNLSSVKVGDAVTLMGIDGEEEISPHDIADAIGSVSYEIISRFGKRLPRVYLRDGKPVSFKSIATGLKEVGV